MNKTIFNNDPASVEAMIEEMTASEYKQWSDGHPHQLLDVREEAEFGEGKLEFTHHIPLGKLEAQFEALSKDTPIVVYCRSGVRSMRACEFLAFKGFEAINLKGGIKAYK